MILSELEYSEFAIVGATKYISRQEGYFMLFLCEVLLHF